MIIYRYFDHFNRCGFPWELEGAAHLFGASVQQVEEAIPICLRLSGASVQQVEEMMQIVYCNTCNSFLLPLLKAPNYFLNESSKITEKSTFLLTHFDDCF